METYEAIKERTSVRDYQDRPIQRELLERLVDAGRRAPTARRLEPWEFIVITEKEALRKVSEMAPNGNFIKGAGAAIVVACRDSKYYLEDGCAATENILLLAADSGLGACWVAGDKKDYAGELLSMLNAPEGLKLISIISLGWPKEKGGQHRARALKDIIHWGRF